LEQSTSPQSSQPSLSPLSLQPSQFYLCKETVVDNDLSSYHESDDQLASLLLYLLSLLGMIGNSIIISNDKDDISSSLSHPSYHEARSTFTTPSLCLLYCQDCTDHRHYYFECPQYICNHAYSMLLCTEYLTVHFVEAGDFNFSGK
jgi:hypothetical protein